MSVNDPDWVEQGDEGQDVYDQLVDRDPLRLRDRCREAEHLLGVLRRSVLLLADDMEAEVDHIPGRIVANTLRVLVNS